MERKAAEMGWAAMGMERKAVQVGRKAMVMRRKVLGCGGRLWEWVCKKSLPHLPAIQYLGSASLLAQFSS
jgi:hypothetical protein